MAKNLVIVESPAKAKTIKKFLGSNYEVLASNGHVRDLPKSQMGVDVKNDFEPKYITIRGKGDLLAKLRKEVKKAERVYLATDPDREGEAISWHLAAALKLEEGKYSRITFNEITKNAIKTSIKNAREIDMNLVDSQQARRAVDRMLGYSISPLLWAKVKRGLSAGRVQSVALRIICDRENEIDAFVPEEYWSLEAKLSVKGTKKLLEAKFYGDSSGKVEIASGEQMEEIRQSVEKSEFVVEEVRKGERIRKAPLPFTTSTLQQEASKVLNYSTQKTMRIAQQLYEDGLISYLRTDSTRISEEADQAAKAFISDNYGADMVATNEQNKESSRRIQDAHEAIRPSYVDRTPAALKETLSRDQFRLYQLIWKRFVASRMQPARYETTSIRLAAGSYRFTSAFSRQLFAGFLTVYVSEDDKVEESSWSGSLEVGDTLKVETLEGVQHFTQPPAHFTEASLVRALEELGIGRPSTYAPTITTILARRYVAKENKNLFVTELGEAVNKIMKEAFPVIVDVTFTANMEGLLDAVEAGDIGWKTIVRNFYPDLEEAVKSAESELENIKIEDEVTEVVCDLCGRNMVIKYGPHGKFLACPGFPECRNTKPYLEKIGVQCPICGGDVVIRKTQKGRRYYACENGPECEFMTWQRPSDKKCPECGGVLLEKGNKLVCNNDKCGAIIEKTE